jgi:hypothetical protein
MGRVRNRQRNACGDDATHPRLRVHAVAARNDCFARPDVAEAKAKLEAAGVQVNEMWDSGVCHGAGFRDPDGNAIVLHHRYKAYA